MLLALAVLTLGAGAHFKHHLDDHDCDSGSTPESHPCVACSGLHGGAVAAVVLATAPVALRPTLEYHAPAPGFPTDPTRGCRSSRAPPLS